MAAPWGDSRYPPFPSPYISPQPHVDPRQQHGRQFKVPQAVPGFYNPAVFPTPSYGPPIPAGAPPLSRVPTVLTPGRGPNSPSLTGHRSYSKELSGDIFFGAPAFPQPQINPPPVQLHPPPPLRPTAPPSIRHSISAPAPPVPQRPDFNAPPIPPRLPLTSPPATGSDYIDAHPVVATGPSHERTPRLPAKILTNAGPHRHDMSGTSPEAEELGRALRVSALDAEAARKREEEELARVLEESLQASSPQPLEPPAFSLTFPTKRMNAAQNRTSVYSDTEMPMPIASPASSTSFSIPSPSFPVSPSSVPQQEEARVFNEPAKSTNSPPSKTQQIKDDEDFARRLLKQESLAARQAEEPAAARTQTQPRLSPQPSPVMPVHLPAAPPPPMYDDVVQTPTSQNLPALSINSQSAPATANTSPTPNSLSPNLPAGYLNQPSPERLNPSSPNPALGRSISANVVPTTPLLHEETRTGRSQSFGAYGTRGAARPPIHESPGDLGRPLVALPTTQPSRSAPLPAVVETSSEADASKTMPQPPPPSPPLRPSQFIDDELLKGVTIGFGPPVMTAVLTPMKGPIPNVIGLPYGRAPPLHFKTPNWHDMLKLMARMSGTRLEATVEAMAVVKAAMQLRVVVNFVKVHQSSDDWHVILYMTIDMPVPPNHKYRLRNASDPALLPYSYTLSPTPAFLRENADGPMSKWYTIPSTTQNQYPTLPITFPDLATYLLSAVENARHAAHDRSSGWGRLAKCIDTFYPVTKDDEEEERSSSGLGGRFGRLFGRTNKISRHDNDERSNLVTPFFADEFGR